MQLHKTCSRHCKKRAVDVAAAAGCQPHRQAKLRGRAHPWPPAPTTPCWSRYPHTSFHLFSQGSLQTCRTRSDICIGITAKMAEQGLTSSQPIANRTLPQWLLPHLNQSELKTTSRPDLILVLPKNKGLAAQKDICTTHLCTWEVHLVEIKYCDDIRPDAQLQNVRVQHSRLNQLLRAQGSHIKMHTILLGVV